MATSCYRKAVACEGCRADAFIRLAYQSSWTEEGCREKVTVLTAGLAKHPDSAEIRLFLSRIYVLELNQPRQALEILAPLLHGAQPLPSASWYAYCAYRDLEEYEDARRSLDAISTEHLDDCLRAHALGDLELRDGQFEEAFKTFSEGLPTASPAQRWTLGFARVAALLGAERIGPAIDEAREAVFGFLDAFDDQHYIDDIVHIGGEPHIFDSTRHAICVCKDLLEDQREFVRNSIDVKMRGALTFSLYKLTENADEPRNDLLIQASKLACHPAMSNDLANACLEARDFPGAIRHHVSWCRWLIRKGRKHIDVGKCHAHIYVDDGGHPNSKAECAALMKAFMEELQSACDDAEITAIFLPTYDFIRNSLRANEQYAELRDAAARLLKVAPDAPDLLWDHAYAHHCRGNSQEAESGYRHLLELNPKDSAALHNLSLLLNERGELEEAVLLSQKAAELSPDIANIKNWHSKLQSRKEAQDEAKRRHEDFLRTAVLRWPKLDYYKRQLACALSLISGYKGLDHLAKLSGIDERYLAGHLRVLEEEGIIIYPREGTFELNKHLTTLIERENTHAIITKIIHGDESVAFRPIFNSRQDYTVYSILISLFPNHLIFPNMALQTIFQFERMKALLDPDEFTFMLRSQVDFCVTSTANYLPLVAFELDSRFHEDDEQKKRDAKKEEIFRVGGVPLLRLRGYGRPTASAFRSQIVHDVTALGKVIRGMAEKSVILSTLEREVDFDSFGTQGADNDSLRWITVSDAAKIAGINAGVVSRALDDGELMGNGLTGRQRRVDAVDLAQWQLRRAAKPDIQESQEQVEKLVEKHVRD
jgi:Flp pilus assembly protein TadD